MTITPIARPQCRLPIILNATHFLEKQRCLAAMNVSDHDTRLFLLNVDTMQSEFFPVPDGQQGPYGFSLGADGCLYNGFFYGRIYRFDPGTKEFALVAEPFGGKKYRLAWGGYGSKAGRIYVGYYPTGEFAEYDIASGKCRLIAPLPGEPFGVYANEFLELPDGRILVMLYGAHSEILLYQPTTGQIEFRREMENRSKIRSLCLLDDERVIYSAANAIRVFNFVEGDWEADHASDMPDFLSWLTFQDGRLLASGYEHGDVYEVSRDGLRRIATGLHSGNRATGGIHKVALDTFVCLGDNGLVAKFSWANGPLATAQLDNLTDTGMNIHSLLKIPERHLAVGSHFINSQIFSVNLDTGVTHSSLNKVTTHAGQITCATFLDGTVYLGVYGGAEILAWLPDEPFVFGRNPRQLCRIAHAQNRPMGLYNDGRLLYTVSRADYGELGGAISVINPSDGTCEVYRDFVPAQNPCAFFKHGGLFAGTTEIYGDQGSCLPEAEDAVIFVWSVAERKTVHSVVPWPGKTLRALAISPAGKLIGFGVEKYFLFDVDERTLTLRDWTEAAPSSGIFLDENRFLMAIPTGEENSKILLLELDANTTHTVDDTDALRFFERLETGEILASRNGAEIVKLEDLAW